MNPRLCFSMMLLGTAIVVLLVHAAIAGVIIWGVGDPFASVSDDGNAMPSAPFDSSGWRSASAHDESEDSVRLLMGNSFLETQEPLGKTRAQIVNLLGESDDTPYFSNYDLVYHLGPQRGLLGLDCEWLVFRLTDGVVSEARIVSD